MSCICSTLKTHNIISIACQHICNFTFSFISPVRTYYCFYHNSFFFLRGESGNKTVCKVSVNVDVTAPKCTVSFSGTPGLAGWYKSVPATAKITTSDEHSGVGSYDLTTSQTPSYNNGNNKQQSDTASQTWYGYVKDNVGNVNKCNNTVKVDTVPPTCTITKSGTSGTNGWYKEKNVTLTLNPTDGLSGVGQTGLSTNATPPLGSTRTGTQGDTSGITWYGRVQDKAGNIATYSTIKKLPKLKLY